MHEQWRVDQLKVTAEIGKVPTATAILTRDSGDPSTDFQSSITLTAQGQQVISPDEVLQYREYVRRIVEDFVQTLNKLPVEVQG
ncbi:MAG: hypothetical protein HYT49_00790 [Candidatus Wildermuthbacteria bacterium]|nr:hypothetical protein [Candidatus Wildermuthbacteria bacterium]